MKVKPHGSGCDAGQEMIAALPMYDWPEVQAENNVLWSRVSQYLASHLIEAPGELDRTPNLQDLWLDPDLLLSQTCSYPLETMLCGKVKYVATPSYSAEGCEIAGHYRSVILMRCAGQNLPVPHLPESILPADLQDLRFAMNGSDSMSGYHALQRDLAATGREIPVAHVTTGSHRASIIAVAEGKADFCAVDCVSWAMALHYEAAAKNVHVAGWTKPRPGLPLITSLRTSAAVHDQLVNAAKLYMAAVVLAAPTEF